jgi:hypothetical protein
MPIADFEDVKLEYRQRIASLFSSLGKSELLPQLVEIEPFDIAHDFFNQSPRLGADPIAPALIAMGVKLPDANIPSCLAETTINGNSYFKRRYLEITEPLINDRVFIFICNEENAVKAKLDKEKNPQEREALKIRLELIKKEKKNYINDMENLRIKLLEAARNDYIEKLVTEYPEQREILNALKEIDRDNELQTRQHCLNAYGKHQALIDKLKTTIPLDKIYHLGQLCNHHNDAAYLKPKYYTKTEIFFSSLKILAPIIGITLIILGFVGAVPTLGASSTLIAGGVAIALSPAVIEGIGHIIHTTYQRRAPDFVRVLMLGVSVVMGGLSLITAGVGPLVAQSIAFPAVLKASLGLIALVPTGIVRQLYNAPRQSGPQFLANVFDFPYYFVGLKKRVDKNFAYYSGEVKQNSTLVTTTSTALEKPEPEIESSVAASVSPKPKMSPARTNLLPIFRAQELKIISFISHLIKIDLFLKSKRSSTKMGWNKTKASMGPEVKSDFVKKSKEVKESNNVAIPDLEVTVSKSSKVGRSKKPAP